MTIFLLLRKKINVLIDKVGYATTQEAFFVILDMIDSVVKLLNVILSVSLETVSFSAD